jgi:hypothetical protein
MNVMGYCFFNGKRHMTNTINRFVIHATSEGKPHTATIDHYTRFAAVQMFTVQSLFSDTVINTVDELGPIDLLD